MKTASDQLHHIIHSLSPTEKRYVKLFIRNNTQGDSGDYLLLLDSIRNMQEYDEQALRQQLEGKGSDSLQAHFAVIKKRLYDLLMRALRNYSTGHTVNARLYDQLRNIELLHDRGLYAEAAAQLKTARRLAARYESHWVIGELIRWEKNLQKLTTYTMEAAAEVDALKKEEDKVLQHLQNINDYWQQYAHIFLLRKATGQVRSPQDIKKREAIIHHPLLQNKGRALSFEAQRLYHLTFANYAYMSVDDEQYVNEVTRKLLQFLESYPDQVVENPALYASVLYNYILSCRHFPDKKEEIAGARRRLNELAQKSSSQRHSKMHAQVFRNDTLISMKDAFSEGAFDEAADKATYCEEQMKKYARQLSPRDRVIISYHLAIACIGAGRYDNSLLWINRALNDPDLSTLSEGRTLALMLQLIAHFELGNLLMLEHLSISVYRFLSKRQRIFGFEAAIMEFIRSQLSYHQRGKGLKPAFVKLRDRLAQLQQDDFERKQMENFDFVAWLDSKINGRPFAELVREKAITMH